MYDALYGRRCYQSYGCLSKIDFNEVDEELGLHGKDKVFDIFIRSLQRAEMPARIEELLGEILKESYEGEIKFISRATFVRHFRTLTDEEKTAFLNKLDDVLDGIGENE